MQITHTPHFRFSGRPPQGDVRHALQEERGAVIAPIEVPVPGGGYVPQYAPTVVGRRNVYDPAGDCDGYFMSSKFQVNNNCYNYACNVATNSFAQPGRKHGIRLDDMTGEKVVAGAEKDGLLEISEKPMSWAEMKEKAKQLPPGHFVALLISQPDESLRWPGDYHWVRCDDNGTWSQKDGTDAVTNFDFAGHPITDPAKANWTVNEGPIGDGNPSDAIVSYTFHAIMFVPDGKADII